MSESTGTRDSVEGNQEEEEEVEALLAADPEQTALLGQFHASEAAKANLIDEMAELEIVCVTKNTTLSKSLAWKKPVLGNTVQIKQEIMDESPSTSAVIKTEVDLGARLLNEMQRFQADTTAAAYDPTNPISTLVAIMYSRRSSH